MNKYIYRLKLDKDEKKNGKIKIKTIIRETASSKLKDVEMVNNEFKNKVKEIGDENLEIYVTISKFKKAIKNGINLACDFDLGKTYYFAYDGSKQKLNDISNLTAEKADKYLYCKTY